MAQYPTQEVSYGQSGQNVVQLQQFLISQGMSIPAGATGYFGDETRTALTQWQNQNGITGAGVGTNWGPQSISAASSASSYPTWNPNTNQNNFSGIANPTQPSSYTNQNNNQSYTPQGTYSTPTSAPGSPQGDYNYKGQNFGSAGLRGIASILGLPNIDAAAQFLIDAQSTPGWNGDWQTYAKNNPSSIQQAIQNVSVPPQSSNTGTGNTGAIPTDTSGNTGGSGTGNPQLDALLGGFSNFLNRMSQNGQVLNPNINFSDPSFMAQFVSQATNEIDPYYKNLLATAQDQFTQQANYAAQQELGSELDLAKQYKQQYQQVGANAAEQGFAQSGQRTQQESDLAYQANRQVQQARAALANQQNQIATGFASQYGTGNLPSIGITAAPEFGSIPGNVPVTSTTFSSGASQPLYSLSSQLTNALQNGTNYYQEQTDINNRANQLASAFAGNQLIGQQRQLTI